MAQMSLRSNRKLPRYRCAILVSSMQKTRSRMSAFCMLLPLCFLHFVYCVFLKRAKHL